MNKKKIITMAVAMGLVGVVGIGGTLAYLTAETNQVTNTFAMGPGFGTGQDIKLDLYENVVKNTENDGEFQQLDKITQKNEIYLSETGETSSVPSTGEGIRYSGVFPGSIIPKNPTVELEAETPDARAYVQVTGIDSMKTYDIALVGNATITDAGLAEEDFSEGIKNTDWVQVYDSSTNSRDNMDGGDGIYRYVGAIDGVATVDSIIPGSDTVARTTAPLFTAVSADSSINEEKLEALVEDGIIDINDEDGSYQLLNIVVQAAVIQSANIKVTESDDLVAGTGAGYDVFGWRTNPVNP